ncbi:WXG100 family type VII secretion target [Plantactinospora sp. KLBMP9567]|uniref:WXG100 family type VII secretion target n=1 Tax=Plantactinospora sp. KLBMP9567 TaxID=3085900 RepID=UPI00298293AA|nr:WXG100 family type VII secretion target [Plantactinospora sp. KLBMP9567]MDW5327939.1 WXG100 family type VII secretion target [Plantactinospora sp. KLBMP9567]
MAQTFTHDEGNAQRAAQLVDQARGMIEFQVKNIDQSVQRLKNRGWEGPAATKFYTVAAEMVDGARRLQNKMDEMRGGLEDVNRTYADASDAMTDSVGTINVYNIA